MVHRWRASGLRPRRRTCVAGSIDSVEQRLEQRRRLSAPLLAQLRERLLMWKEQLLPKHPMAEAINYALGQWAELSVFCSDGAVPIDNNVSEREIKRVVLNRKNSCSWEIRAAAERRRS